MDATGNNLPNSISQVIEMVEKHQKNVFRLIDQHIEQGETGLYVLKALLSASDNWDTPMIVRKDLFRSILLEGIEHGALAPENDLGWEFLETAAEYNNPEEFINDIDLYYEILDTALKDGNAIARNIMNTIWEPEQIIEED